MSVKDNGVTLWFTGLPCSGKSSVADAVAEELRQRGFTRQKGSMPISSGSIYVRNWDIPKKIETRI